MVWKWFFLALRKNAYCEKKSSRSNKMDGVNVLFIFYVRYKVARCLADSMFSLINFIIWIVWFVGIGFLLSLFNVLRIVV